MRCTMVPVAVLASLTLFGAIPATAAAAPTLPLPPPLPARTAVSFDAPGLGIHLGTTNESEARPGLSIVKLYLADYALRRGHDSKTDRSAAERMIRFSDDSAADAMDTEYPHAINAIAAEYHLPATQSPGYWGDATTSTADVSRFLERLRAAHPDSPIFTWMATAGRVAADGTVQNWGTGTLYGVQGTKWGWSDKGAAQVASASIGPGFTIAAQTHGHPADETADVTDVITRLLADIVLHR